MVMRFTYGVKASLDNNGSLVWLPWVSTFQTMAYYVHVHVVGKSDWHAQ